jgi:hypothetical protein
MKMIRSSTARCAGHVACIEDVRNVHRLLVESLEGIEYTVWKAYENCTQTIDRKPEGYRIDCLEDL